MSTLVLIKKDVSGLLQMSEVITVVEQAFKQLAQDKARMPPKAYLLLDRGDFRAMPAYLPGASGMKWVSVYPQNPSLGLIGAGRQAHTQLLAHAEIFDRSRNNECTLLPSQVSKTNSLWHNYLVNEPHVNIYKHFSPIV